MYIVGHGYSGSQVEKEAPALLQKARGIGHRSTCIYYVAFTTLMLRYRAIFVINQVHLPTTTIDCIDFVTYEVYAIYATTLELHMA